MPTPASAGEETVVVYETEPTSIVLPAVVAVSETETKTAIPAFYVPAWSESVNTQVAAADVADAEPLLIAATTAAEVESGFMQNWWQRGTALLVVCLGALMPFSSRRFNTRDESASVKL